MNVPVQVLEREQVDRLLALPDPEDVLGRRDAALLGTLYYVAATAVEVANLNLSDVSWRKGEVLLRSDDGSKRHVKVAEELRELLEGYRDRSRRLVLAQAGPDAPQPRAFFLGTRLQRIRVQDIRQIVGATVKSAGIRADVNLSTLRLSRAWHLSQEGRSPESIQRFLGATGRSGRNVI